MNIDFSLNKWMWKMNKRVSYFYGRFRFSIIDKNVINKKFKEIIQHSFLKLRILKN